MGAACAIATKEAATKHELSVLAEALFVVGIRRCFSEVGHVRARGADLAWRKNASSISHNCSVPCLKLLLESYLIFLMRETSFDLLWGLRLRRRGVPPSEEGKEEMHRQPVRSTRTYALVMRDTYIIYGPRGPRHGDPCCVQDIGNDAFLETRPLAIRFPVLEEL